MDFKQVIDHIKGVMDNPSDIKLARELLANKYKYARIIYEESKLFTKGVTTAHSDNFPGCVPLHVVKAITDSWVVNCSLDPNETLTREELFYFQAAGVTETLTWRNKVHDDKKKAEAFLVYRDAWVDLSTETDFVLFMSEEDTQLSLTKNEKIMVNYTRHKGEQAMDFHNPVFNVAFWLKPFVRETLAYTGMMMTKNAHNPDFHHDDYHEAMCHTMMTEEKDNCDPDGPYTATDFCEYLREKYGEAIPYEQMKELNNMLRTRESPPAA
jgi:hypothetical protein